jgi:hypothetical protein
MLSRAGGGWVSDRQGEGEGGGQGELALIAFDDLHSTFKSSTLTRPILKDHWWLLQNFHKEEFSD